MPALAHFQGCGNIFSQGGKLVDCDQSNAHTQISGVGAKTNCGVSGYRLIKCENVQIWIIWYGAVFKYVFKV